MSNFDICKDKWFFEPKNEQERDSFLEWAYDQGMIWHGDSTRNNNYLSAECAVGGNSYAQGVLGWCGGGEGGRDYYESRGHVEIFPVFKYKMYVDNVPLPVVESPQQKQIRELEEIARLLNEAQSLVLQAETIADECGLEFDLDLGGYGMGGTYYSEKYVEESGSRWTTAGWNASSQSC